MSGNEPTRSAGVEAAEKRKLELEARLLELDVARRESEAALESVRLERDKLGIERDLAYHQHQARVAEFARSTELRSLQLQLEDRELREYDFYDRVDEGSADTLIGQLRYWETRDVVDEVKRPIRVNIKSPGGSIIDGLDIYDYVIHMRERGWRIDTVATGIAASMAGVLLQMGETRYIRRNATLHMHEAGSFALGQTSEIKDHLAFVDALERKCAKIYADRTEGTLSIQEIREMWERKEVHLTAEDAVAKKLADRVL